MSNIHDININDIRKFLLINKINIKESDDELYNIAFDLMQDNTTIYNQVPASIIEWMLAYNALLKRIWIPERTINDITNMSQDELDGLSKFLGVKNDKNDKNGNINKVNSIINILRYMNKIDYQNTLKFDEHPDLYRPLLLNSDFNFINKLLDAKPSLDNILIELFQQILEFKLPKDKKIFVNLKERDELQKFILYLINTKKFDLLEKLLPIISNYGSQIYNSLLNTFTENYLLDIYFAAFPINYRIESIRPFFYITIKNLNVNDYYLLSTFLKFLMNNNDFSAVGFMIDIIEDWDLINENPLILTYDERKKINLLIEEGKDLLENI
jgi:hypothetical protein